MYIDTAKALIGNLIYKPGWEFICEDGTSRFEGAVVLTIWYPCPDSNRDNARLGYPDVEPCATVKNGKEIDAGTPTIRPDGRARASFTLMIGDCDDIGLYYLIDRAIAKIDDHERREFMRTKPTYWAPFHPHHADGIERWAKATGQPFEHVQNCDLTFGLA
jgi:hypothetical protein